MGEQMFKITKYLMSATVGCSVLMFGPGAAFAQPAPVSAAAEDGVPIRTLFDVRTRLRDGVELSSDVWLPAEPGKYPIILIRTPYIKTMPEINFPELAGYFAKRGYAFVVQDVRGRGDSGGEFDFFFQEDKDGYDTVEGLAAQSWSNGRVCMMGLSYWATVQWLAAREKPPHLTCIAPASPAGRFFDELPYMGGAFGMRWALEWLNDASGKISQRPNSSGLDWERILNHRPLLTSDEILGRKMRLYREFLQHDTLDAYWRRIRLEKADFERIDIPVLTTTGTFDGDQTGAMYFWDGMERYAPDTKSDRYIVMGPWTHVQTFMGGAPKQGEIALNAEAVLDMKKLHLEFFDHYLKQTAPKPDWPRARIYVTGHNAWRTYSQYPPAAQMQPLFLSSGGRANSLTGNGALDWTLSSRQASDRYIYDPKNPVHVPQQPAASDRRAIEKRQDVLVYTTAPLTKAVEVVGPVAVELYAASDAKDTDFTANIVDVYPDGRAVSLGANPVGIIRARYRHGFDKQVFLKPGAVERYRIDLGHLAHAFLPGHRIRIEISSSAYPMFNPNQNTGNPVATDVEWKIARQTIFHDRKYPSAVLLPIVTE